MDIKNKEIGFLQEKLLIKLIDTNRYISEYENYFINNREFINEINSFFFNDLYWLYWNFITIKLCALMESPMTNKNNNLSVQRLIYLLKETNLNCYNEIKEIEKEILLKLKPFKNARNKAFTHFDFDSMYSKNELENIYFEEIRTISNQIGFILNKISIELDGMTLVCFENTPENGSKKIINLLKLGIESQKIINDK